MRALRQRPEVCVSRGGEPNLLPAIEPERGDADLLDLVLGGSKQQVPVGPGGQRDLQRGEAASEEPWAQAHGRRRPCSYLQRPGGQEDAGAGDGLRLEPHKHVGPQAVVHVVPTSHKRAELHTSAQERPPSPPPAQHSCTRSKLTRCSTHPLQGLSCPQFVRNPCLTLSNSQRSEVEREHRAVGHAWLMQLGTRRGPRAPARSACSQRRGMERARRRAQHVSPGGNLLLAQAERKTMQDPPQKKTDMA